MVNLQVNISYGVMRVLCSWLLILYKIIGFILFFLSVQWMSYYCSQAVCYLFVFHFTSNRFPFVI